MSLADTLNRAMAAKNQPTTPAPDQTARTAELLRAKSGKAVGPTSGPKISALGEEQATAAGRADLSQVMKQGQVAAENVAMREEDQARREELSRRELELTRKEINQNFDQKRAAVETELKKAVRENDVRRAERAAQQVGFEARLNSDKYIHQLQLNGDRARLDNELAFDEALRSDIFGEYNDLFRQGILNNEMLGADAREFQMQIARIDLESAMAIAATEAKAANMQAQYGAISRIVDAGVDYARGRPESEPEPESPPAAGTLPRYRTYR